MRMSQALREWQLTGEVPETDPVMSFWMGWLCGGGRIITDPKDMNDRRDMAIRCAEFIEERAR